MDAGPRPGTRRGRRVSCTVALAVAGALAAVTVGATTLGDLFPGGDSDSGGGHDAAQPPVATGSRSPATATPGTPAGSAPVSRLPEAFAGTWKGPTTERSGAPHGTLTAVFVEGRKGEEVARLSYRFDALGTTVVCRGVGTLASGTATELKVRERADPDARTGAMCTGGEADLVFTLTSGDTLRYESHEEAAGRPKGTLTRSDG
jgi:hypothetical protein